MFAEPATPHHRAHFHAYCQSDVGIFGIDPVELIGDICQNGSNALLRRGRNYMVLSCWKIGVGCRKGVAPRRSIR
jgi:hypothetical protein